MLLASMGKKEMSVLMNDQNKQRKLFEKIFELEKISTAEKLPFYKEKNFGQDKHKQDTTTKTVQI